MPKAKSAPGRAGARSSRVPVTPDTADGAVVEVKAKGSAKQRASAERKSAATPATRPEKSLNAEGAEVAEKRETSQGRSGSSAAPSAPAALKSGAAIRPRAAPADTKVIRVRGAKEHNLKNVNVEIPRDQLVVLTGLSGSGKSSLAFDTIFAEGQRKYMESLSAYARQFLGQLKKPDVEEVEGIPPTIAIEQRSASGNPRSTVATTTEIYDYLRLLYARCGTPYSWAPIKTDKDNKVLARSGVPITAMTSTQIVDSIMTKPSGTRLMVLAPVIRGKKGFHREALEEFVAQGWGRARVNGTVVELREILKEPGENPLGLGRYEKHDIDAVVDRIVLSPEVRQRLAESVEAALKMADGAVVISVEAPSGASQSSSPDSKPSPWTDIAFSTKFADPEHPEYALEELSPRLFSFNSPHGACQGCDGLGTILEFDEALVVPRRVAQIFPKRRSRRGTRTGRSVRGLIANCAGSAATLTRRSRGPRSAI